MSATINQETPGSDYARAAAGFAHDAAAVLKAGMQRHRRVLGSQFQEWVRIEHAEFAVDQLTSMYREAIGEANGANELLRQAREQLADLRKLTDAYRTSIDRLQREGLALARKGRALQRQLRTRRK